MDRKAKRVSCSGCPLTRRGFLAAGCAAACAGAVAPGAARAAETKKMRIRVVYALHAEVQPGPDWPNVGFDFRPVMDRIDNTLRQGCPEFEFVRSMANGPDQAKALLAEDAKDEVQGYIVYQMNCWNQVAQTMATSGKPVLYADFQYAGSGGFLVYTAAFLRQQAGNVGFVASSKPEDLIAAVKCFGFVRDGAPAADFASLTAQVRRKLTPGTGDLGCKPDALACLTPAEWQEQIKSTKILAVLDEEARPLSDYMGIPLEYLPFAEVNAAWEKADRDESRAIAERWSKNAGVVKDVSMETLIDSAAMYLAQKAVMKAHEANAITMNCLGGFYGGHIHAYPCLGFHELNNEGLVGACECDIRSTATMVAFGALTQGRPGYISDPVIDTAKRQIIYAHCVASNRAFGPTGEKNPYDILTHSEDRAGASVRSILPLGYMTTSLEVAPDRKEILFHQGKAVANDPNDRACRTKLSAEPVGDIEKLFGQWDQWGWHRVTFYGDLKEPVFALADHLGWKVLEET